MSQVNQLANFMFLTADTNMKLSDTPPERYLPAVMRDQPGAVESHWIPIPTNPDAQIPTDGELNLWKVENYLAFLEARRELLAAAANRFLDQLLVGAGKPAIEVPPREMIDVSRREVVAQDMPTGEEDEMAQIRGVIEWITDLDLDAGVINHELVDAENGQEAVLDLAWSDGLQPGLGEPLALLLNESDDTEKAAGRHGFRFYTTVADLQRYVIEEVLVENVEPRGAA